MSIFDRAKRDWQKHTTGNDGVPITLTNADTVPATCKVVGFATKHHIGFDTDGILVNSKNAHISFSEKQCTDASFSLRNAAGEVDLKGYKVEWKDSTENSIKYVIREWFQDESLGVIVCILGDYE
jgi:hypothetical protein